jgi:hypothetical protein
MEDVGHWPSTGGAPAASGVVQRKSETLTSLDGAVCRFPEIVRIWGHPRSEQCYLGTTLVAMGPSEAEEVRVWIHRCRNKRPTRSHLNATSAEPTGPAMRTCYVGPGLPSTSCRRFLGPFAFLHPKGYFFIKKSCPKYEQAS